MLFTIVSPYVIVNVLPVNAEEEVSASKFLEKLLEISPKGFSEIRVMVSDFTFSYKNAWNKTIKPITNRCIP